MSLPDDDLVTLDPAVLDELRVATGGDDAFVNELIGTYLSDGAELVAAIEAGVATGDAGAVLRPAHTLKSSSASVGAMRLAQLARELEEESRAGRLPGAARVDAIRAEWQGVGAALTERAGAGEGR